MKIKSDFSWFDLANYDRFHNMTTREWAYEIGIREELYELLDNGYDGVADKGFVESVIDRLNGSFDSVDKNFFVQHYCQTVSTMIANEPEKTASIRPLHFFDLWQKFYFFPDVFKKYWRACKKTQQMDMSKDSEIAFMAIDDVIKPEGRALLAINMHATDKQIEKDFSEWLKQARQKPSYKPPKEKALRKIFTQQDFNKWIRYQYIPYIDLKLIERIGYIKLNQETIRELLYPDEFEVKMDRIKDTTSKWALSLVTNNISSALHMQADSEQAESISIAE